MPQSSNLSLGHLYLRFNQFCEKLRVQSVKIKRQFFRPRFPSNVDKKINLHLGCGSIHHPNFINIDARPLPHIHYVRALDNLSPFKDNSVDLIYACHCLEHFSYYETHRVLSEWNRVLKMNGILRLSVPDFDLLLEIYSDFQYNIEPIIGLVMGGQDYEFNLHKTIFNKESLTKSLSSAGFEQITTWQPGACEMKTFDDWSGRKLANKYLVSLNLEAIKTNANY